MTFTVSATSHSPPDTPLAPFHFDRRDPRSDEVFIKILFRGVCHSGIYNARND